MNAFKPVSSAPYKFLTGCEWRSEQEVYIHCVDTSLSQVRCRHSPSEETCYVKGSVESVLGYCSSFQFRTGASLEIGEKERRRVLDAASELGSNGRR